MKIVIVGTGGVGGYFGAKLAKAGNDVTFIARGEHLKAIKDNGLTIKSVLGDFHIDAVNATSRIPDVEDAGLVLLCVKAWQTKDILMDLKSIVKQNTILLPLQNGVSVLEELKEQIPDENIVGGLCRTISKIESPGVICHFGVIPTIIFGEIDNRMTERIGIIKDLFDTSGITSVISEDIQSDIWKKFISICVSGLLAVTRSTYGEIRELKGTRQMMIELLTEVYQLALRMSIKIDNDFLSKTISFIDTLPYESTTSLSRDVLEGKPSEIDYQNGAVVRLGEKIGFETPVNRFVYNCIQLMEERARRLI